MATTKKFYLIGAIYNPRPTTDATGTDTTPKAEIIVAPEYILAATQEEAKTLLSRRIPEAFIDKFDQVSSTVKEA